MGRHYDNMTNQQNNTRFFFSPRPPQQLFLCSWQLLNIRKLARMTPAEIILLSAAWKVISSHRILPFLGHKNESHVIFFKSQISSSLSKSSCQGKWNICIWRQGPSPRSMLVYKGRKTQFNCVLQFPSLPLPPSLPMAMFSTIKSLGVLKLHACSDTTFSLLQNAAYKMR